MSGTLFTHDYLAQGVRATADWRDAQARVPAFHEALNAAFAAVAKPAGEVEAQIELRIVQPVLEALGWKGLYTVQARIDQKGRKNVPDYLFFATPEDHAKADAQSNHGDRYRHAIALGDAKAWSISLDKRGGGAGLDEAPTGQLLRYMDAASAASDRRVLWGLLTNGRIWRLYYQDARSRLDDYFEVDLEWALERPGAQGDLLPARDPDTKPADLLTLFLLFFEREAFLPGAGGRTRHQVALEEGKRWEARIRDDLSEVVFDKVFPGLIRAIVAADRQSRVEDPVYQAEVREAALTVLYRLLFALYAEDRDLLPTRSDRFDDYSLSLLRDEVHTRTQDLDALSPKVGPMWSKTRDLFRLIDEGDDDLGVPPYNGGLFAQERSPLLERITVPDRTFAPLLHLLSHVDGKRVNYRDLSVRELGSIYERLLEHEPVADPAAEQGVDVRLSVFARKGSGSYYTPDVLVKLIIERTLTPLAEEAEAAFVAALQALPSRADPDTVRAELDHKDPARRILSFKVVDPAMGSGHFLVSLVDWLAERALLADDEATRLAHDAGHDWSSPATREIAALRAAVRKEAVDNGWAVSEAQLSDANLIKRSVLKRCVYGVDKNPMAVELAKVALWLHTFTAGAPLSFLDHHLRCGDSLFGERVHDVLEALQKRGSLLIAQAVVGAQTSVKAMERIEGLSDARLEDVKESERSFADVTHATGPLCSFLDLWHAVRWLKPTGDDLRAWHGFLDGQFGDPLTIAAGMAEPNRPRDLPADATLDWLDRAEETADQPDLLGAGASTLDYLRLMRLLARARDLVAEQRFLHWQVAFPGVWTNWGSSAPQGGFDAVIGNPPWDRMKMQEVEWFAERAPTVARQARAADRKAAVARLAETGDPLAVQYARARDAAETAMRIARDGAFPLLSRGDINLYSLFVERAQSLIGPKGIAGLLVPSGIASDLTASAFFKSVSTAGRVLTLFDFENRRGEGREHFFPAVDSRFKFCAFIVGGNKRVAQAALCGFFLTDAPEDDDPRLFHMAAADFARVNPNTGTAPIFRSARDAELTRAVYGRLPVLVDRSSGEEMRAWPVRYQRMFDMTNDSGLFWTRARLEKEGAYETGGGRWSKADQTWSPLFAGRMIQHFNHRAAGVEVNEANLHNAANSDRSDETALADPGFMPEPQYWVADSDIDWPYPSEWGFAFRDIARSTDVRTMIGTIVPKAGFGNKAPLIVPTDMDAWCKSGPFLAGNLSALAFDFVTRSKVQSTAVNWFIVEQLPVVPPAAYDRHFGARTAAEIVRDHVVKLSYTAHDLAPFARDMGWVEADETVKPPHPWDETERRLMRARLDALYFILYGLTEPEDVRHVLSTFPIVRRKDIAEHGVYLTEVLILWFMKALLAGDPDRDPPVADLIAQARKAA